MNGNGCKICWHVGIECISDCIEKKGYIMWFDGFWSFRNMKNSVIENVTHLHSDYLEQIYSGRVYNRKTRRNWLQPIHLFFNAAYVSAWGWVIPMPFVFSHYIYITAWEIKISAHSFDTHEYRLKETGCACSLYTCTQSRTQTHTGEHKKQGKNPHPTSVYFKHPRSCYFPYF